MHDHILHNYNIKYSFNNVECMRHLKARIIKMDEKTTHEDINEKKVRVTTTHSWLNQFKSLLSKTNIDRNNLIKLNKDYFDNNYLDNLNNEYDKLICIGFEENKNDKGNAFIEQEYNFLKDLKKYKDSYLKWAFNFKLPSTNNISERGLRPSKSKMKASGQFRNIKYAKYYANIRSYIETCKRHDINIIYACSRLMDGNPYTLDEILKYNNKNDT